jgi:hypothetical protein
MRIECKVMEAWSKEAERQTSWEEEEDAEKTEKDLARRDKAYDDYITLGERDSSGVRLSRHQVRCLAGHDSSTYRSRYEG